MPQCWHFHNVNASVFRTLSYKMRHDTTRASARVVSDAFLRQSPKDRSINIVKMSTMRHLNLGEIKVTINFVFTQHSSLDLTRFLCIKFTYQHSSFKRNICTQKNSLNNKSFKTSMSLLKTHCSSLSQTLKA